MARHTHQHQVIVTETGAVLGSRDGKAHGAYYQRPGRGWCFSCYRCPTDESNFQTEADAWAGFNEHERQAHPDSDADIAGDRAAEFMRRAEELDLDHLEPGLLEQLQFCVGDLLDELEDRNRRRSEAWDVSVFNEAGGRPR